jgi:FkbM family methyltransferase
VKKILRSLFNLFGLEIRRKKLKVTYPYIRNEKMIQALRRFKSINYNTNTIVDIGAASGYWSLSAKEIWPQCSYLLFEPLSERKGELNILVKQNPNFQFVPFAAGKGKSKIQFVISPDLDGSGIASSSTPEANIRTVDVSSIDLEVKSRGLKGPYIIKLDTHGFEVPILEGCSEILKDVSLFIIECYGFHIADNSLLFWEMCQYMDKLGYRLFDVVDVMNRPKDGAFWQCDAFFIRKENSLFKYNHYQ